MDLKNKRAVIYARYSSSNQHEESIEGQVRICKAEADRDGCIVVDIYADRALTGTNDKRPEFLKMINDSYKHKFDVVYLYKTDRFARNRYDSVFYKKKLKDNNIQIRYAQEAIPNTPEGIILEATLEGFAEYFSTNLSINVQRGKYEAATKGIFQGSRPPLGYKLNKGHLEVDEDTAPLVKRIFSMYDNGTNIIEIVSTLFQENIKNQFDKNFNRQTIKRMLVNEIYIGTMVSGKFARKEKEIIKVENAAPALIDKAMFNRVQKRLELKKTRPRFDTGKNKHPLSTKLQCGSCGRTITLKQQGDKYKYLVCIGRTSKMCDKKRLNYFVLIEKLMYLIKTEILSEKGIKNIAALAAKQQTPSAEDFERDSIKIELDKTQKAIDNIMKAIEAGIFTPTTANRLKELEAKHITLQNKLNEKTDSDSPENLTSEQIEFFLYSYVIKLGTIPDYDDSLLKTFIEKVVIFDDYAEVTLNIFDNTSIVKVISL